MNPNNLIEYVKSCVLVNTVETLIPLCAIDNNKSTWIDLPRRKGKSTIIALSAIYYATTASQANIFIMVPRRVNVNDIFSTVINHLSYGQHGFTITHGVNLTANIIRTNSRIIALAESDFQNLRGVRADYLFCDNVEFFSEQTIEDIIRSKPINSKLVFTSTGKSTHNMPKNIFNYSNDYSQPT